MLKFVKQLTSLAPTPNNMTKPITLKQLKDYFLKFHLKEQKRINNECSEILSDLYEFILEQKRVENKK